MIQIVENDGWKNVLNSIKINQQNPTYFVVKTNNLEMLNVQNWKLCGGDML
jgi:hypothetical protein